MTCYPPLFLSHGAPNMALHESPVKNFMQELGSRFPKPDAIICCSAHFETNGIAVVTDPAPEMIYDFAGFEPELREFAYPAMGAPELAGQVASRIEKAGLPVSRVKKRGFDHGMWVPLSLAYPQADIPVVQLSIDPNSSPSRQYEIGSALSAYPSENIAIIATGNITHNLQALFNRGRDTHLDRNIKNWVDVFLKWFEEKLTANEVDALLQYRTLAPFAAENHPTDEHLLPLFVALGAAGMDYRAEKLHHSFMFDFLAMDAWAFHLEQT